MKKGVRISLVPMLFISQLFLCTVVQAQVDYFAPDKVYEFAEHLYKEKDYLRAAGEFERYLLLAGMPEVDDSTLYRIGMCYLLGNSPERAVTYFLSVADKFPLSIYRDRASYQIANSYFRMGEFDQSIEHINKNPPQSSESCGRLRDLLVLNYLYLKDWEKAHGVFSSFTKDNSDCSGSADSALRRLTFEGTRLPYKSKVVAGLMSSLVPGSGKMYAHRFTDGLYSLITIGLAGWQAYEGFSEEGTRSARGWIYGTLGTVFYAGNVYGSVVAVKIHNRRIEDNFLIKLDICLMSDD